MFLFLATFSCFFTTTISWEYCKPEIHEKLCPKSLVMHTVCDPSKAFDARVDMISNEFVGHVPITRKIKRIFMHIHNDYRNRVASGEEIKNATDQKYPKASRMRELIWDNELMYVAHIHTAQTRMGHDKCRDTQRFAFSGQNLGWKGSSYSKSIIDVLNSSLHEMYLEKDVVPNPVAMADKYSPETAEVYPWCYYLACNYDGTNIVDSYIYKTDTSQSATQCSDWDVGKSSQYEHLCANSGEYFDPKKMP